MIGKKINQLPTELAPVTTDLTIIGDPVTGVSKKITLSQIANLFATSGTVTSVAVTETGDALTITGSPITTSGTINIAFAGTSSQYVNGAGNLTTFPTSLISGSGASGQVTYFNGTNSVTGNNNFFWDTANNRLGIGLTNPQRSIEIFNSTADNHLRLSGNAPSVSMGEAVTGSVYQAKFGLVTTNGQFAAAGVAGDFVIISQTGATIFVTNSTEKMRVQASGNMCVGNTNNTFKLDVTGTGRFTGQLRLESTITDGTNTYTLPSATGTLALTSDIPSLTGYVPYTGATANVDLGTHTLIATKGTFSSSGSGDTVAVTHSSGSGIALNITKGGNGEGLYINKTSGSGNAATIIGTLNATTLVKSGGTSSQFLKADGSVDSTAYGTGSVTSVGLSSATSGVTIGSTPITTSGTITLAIATASGSQQGLLSSTDWTTFNNKQNALTNPVTGTGTTNYLPKFTGTSTIGNSIVTDNGYYVGYNFTGSGSLGGQNFGVDTVGAFQNNLGSYGYRWLVNNGVNELMRLNASGNLGLGVTPSAWASGQTAFDFGTLGSLSTDGSLVVVQNNRYFNGTSNIYKANGHSTLYSQGAGSHVWYNAPSGTAGNAISFTQAMTLDASGRLGIGTTSPNSPLSVKTNEAAEGISIWGRSDNYAILRLKSSTGATNYATIYSDATNLYFNNDLAGANIFGTNAAERMRITSGGNVGIGTTSPISYSNKATLGIQGAWGGQLDIMVGSTSHAQFGSDNYDTGLSCRIQSQDGIVFKANGSTERMRITSGGNVGINTSSPSYTLDVNGTARFGSAIVANLGTGLVYSSSGTLTSTNPSDQRLKNTIKPLSYGLNEILQLNPKTFYYNDDVNKERLKYGFIAQEVKSIMPELARKLNAETDYLGLETEGIYVTLVNAIKELKQELDILKNK